MEYFKPQICSFIEVVVVASVIKCWLTLFPVIPKGVQSPHSKRDDDEQPEMESWLFFPVLATLAVEEDKSYNC